MNKVSKKQYLKALETIKTYEIQSHKKVAVQVDEGIASIDDTWHCVTYDDETIKCTSEFELDAVLRGILTAAQYADYSSDYTSRNFIVKRVDVKIIKHWLKSDKNPWRRGSKGY